MEQWLLMRKGADFEAISEKHGISQVLARVIRNRDVEGDEAIKEYLHGTLSDLAEGNFMKDMQKGVGILAQAVRDHKKIRVIGDYDCDGVNSSYILETGIRMLGGHVDTDIPHRITDGYGISTGLIDKAIEDGVETVITCDNGISALTPIRYGKEKGLTIVVTDHHEVPYEEDVDGSRKFFVPEADAVIDPKQEDCFYPFKELCGAAVAWRFVRELFKAFDRDEKETDFMIENVAIATVADVMDLKGENRILVREGLKRLSETKNEGLKALMKVTDVDPKTLKAYQIGFVIGPCINASGRLDTASRALDLLKETDPDVALKMAKELKNLNYERRMLTEEAAKEAIEQAETYDEDRVLVIYLPEVHESIAGIVAGRVREKYNKPVFVLTDTEGGLVKGSGRSIETYSMYEEMNGVKDVFTKFGGHPMAAGLSLPKENVKLFRRRINKSCSLTENDMKEKVRIDMMLPLKHLSEGLINEMHMLEPYGKGNRRPLFVLKSLRIYNVRILGKTRNAVKMDAVDASGTFMNAIYFGSADDFMKNVKKNHGKVEDVRIACTYYPDINEYRGRRTLQIVIQNYK